jgi:hypothetical protein
MDSDLGGGTAKGESLTEVLVPPDEAAERGLGPGGGRGTWRAAEGLGCGGGGGSSLVLNDLALEVVAACANVDVALGLLPKKELDLPCNVPPLLRGVALPMMMMILRDNNNVVHRSRAAAGPEQEPAPLGLVLAWFLAKLHAATHASTTARP